MSISQDTGSCSADGRSLDSRWQQKIEELHRETARGALPAKVVALVNLAISASPAHSDQRAIRLHMCSALEHGATSAEVLAVLKLCTVVPIHSFAMAAPILHECFQASGAAPDRFDASIPGIELLRAQGKFNPAWDHICEWDPQWLELMLAVGLAPWSDGVLDARTLELLCIAVDVAVLHMYHPGTARHVKTALEIGVPPQQILEVLKIASTQGVRNVQSSLAILKEETSRMLLRIAPNTTIHGGEIQ